jgi:tetratricopeptide (TPR) repeat protein
MLSLCLIVKATDRESELLDRCLGYVSKYVDEICLTITGENKKCEKVAKKYKAKVSHFEWINDFATARNFNFSQASGDYILWLDCDDILKGADKLPTLLEKMAKDKLDAGVMNYLYEFDDDKNCTVKHLKTRIVKKGSVKWIGELHEDFEPLKEIESYFIKDIEVLHLMDKETEQGRGDRNVLIAETALKNKPKDPRSYWLVANAYMQVGKTEEAKEKYKEFILMSNSDEEKYIANIYLGRITKDTFYPLRAWELRPTYPDAYHLMAEILYLAGKKERALNFIELGLQMPIPDKEIIVYNPRDYDYNPLMMMIKIYMSLGKYTKAFEIVNKLAGWFPSDKKVKEYQAMISTEVKELLDIQPIIEEAEKIKDKEELKKFLDKQSDATKQHPLFASFRNKTFIKKETSGKDLCYYCYPTTKEWYPGMTGGVGGSEEAVINLANKLSKLGWNVTVYNSCGKNAGVYDGVTYINWWEFNIRDNWDVTIFWRLPRPFDMCNDFGKKFLDLHDTILPGEFTPERLKKIDKIFVKTKAHRDLFPDVSDDKFAIIPNGVDPSLFENKIEKNPYLILNTSSADRSLESVLDIFEELIKQEPDKPWKLAWYYGWDTFDPVHKDNNELMAWKAKIISRYEKLRKDGRFEGGMMINHADIAKKYLEAGIFLYPSSFYEVHCISILKAQLAGCLCISSDFAALNETNKYGIKFHTSGDKWGKENTFGDDENKEKYLDAIINQPKIDIDKMKTWAIEIGNWNGITKKWHNVLTNC